MFSVDRGTLIASVKPVLRTDTLFLIAENDLDDIDIDSSSTETKSVNLVGKNSSTETQPVNLVGKKKNKKTLKHVFSRPIQNQPNLTDEQLKQNLLERILTESKKKKKYSIHYQE